MFNNYNNIWYIYKNLCRITSGKVTFSTCRLSFGTLFLGRKGGLSGSSEMLKCTDIDLIS
jgi:hypothetical protein